MTEQKKEKQITLQTTIKDTETNLKKIKNKFQTNPGYHNLEYTKDKFEKKKLESFSDRITNAIKDSCSNTELK